MEQTRPVEILPLGDDDVGIVKWVVYTAVGWNDPPNMPPLEVAVEHPEIARYHRGWGRHGDFGVKAIADGAVAGGAFARLFTDDDHGAGYVDPDTPELGVAVEAPFRGRGLGRRLMEGLAQQAGGLGITRLALSVNNPNPAKRLYESLGYQTVEDDGESSTMVLEL